MTSYQLIINLKYHREWCVHAKKIRYVTEQNFELETNVFRRFYFRFAQFQATFNFRCADFDSTHATTKMHASAE